MVALTKIEGLSFINHVFNRIPKNIKALTDGSENIELFNSLRGCYNKGNSELKATIQYQCMDIILESLEKESDKQEFKNVFDNLTSSKNSL